MVFPVVMHGCESWTIKNTECQRTDVFKLWCWRRLLRVPWTARKSNQSILREINPEYSLERLMLKLKLQYLMQSWLIGKDPDAGKDWRQDLTSIFCDFWCPILYLRVYHFDVNYGYNYIKILDCVSILALIFKWSSVLLYICLSYCLMWDLSYRFLLIFYSRRPFNISFRAGLALLYSFLFVWKISSFSFYSKSYYCWIEYLRWQNFPFQDFEYILLLPFGLQSFCSEIST